MSSHQTSWLNKPGSLGKENDQRIHGSPTPLKAFLNDHLDRLKKCREAACMVDLTKKYCLTGGKTSKQSSLANSNNQSSNNLRQSDGNPSRSWLQEFMNTKNPLADSKSLKRSLERVDLSKSKKAGTPANVPPHDEFTRQFFGKAAKPYRSSVELPGDNFNFKLGSVMQDKELFKRRNLPPQDKDEFSHAREIFDSFKSRMKQSKTALAQK
jgi:hypothetical protein